MQAGLHGTASETVNAILKNGGVRGFYAGYLTTVVREIPFSLIQFPIYEWLKVWGPGPARYCRLSRPVQVHVVGDRVDGNKA